MTEPEYFKNLFQESVPYTFDRARSLRKESTTAENYLWEFLRNKQLGVKFRRQHAIAEYIADFYCHEKKLVIEVDGDVHKTQQEYDACRSEILRSMSVEVLRFANEEVMNDTEKVLHEIVSYISRSQD